MSPYSYKGDMKTHELIKILEQLEKDSREHADDFYFNGNWWHICDKYEEGRADAYLEVIEMLKEKENESK